MFRRPVAAIVLATLLLRPAAAEPSDDVRYQHISRPDGPLSAHVVQIPRGRPDLRLIASVGAGIKGKETVPDMVAAVPPDLGVPLAAVNGDYFEYKTEPRFFGTLQGLCVIEGELVAGPAGTAFCIDRAGQPRMRQVGARFTVTWPDGTSAPFGLNCSPADYRSEVKAAAIVLFTPRFGRSTGTASVREWVLGPAGPGPWLPLRPGQTCEAVVDAVTAAGDTAIPTNRMVLSIARAADANVPALSPGDRIRLRTAFDGDLSDTVTAVSGDPLLLTDGRILPPPAKTPVTPAQRAPRTAIGFNATQIMLVVVDGRQSDLSVGMDHRELAEFMSELGCTDALNLDGGGSSTLWWNGRVVNSPSDGALRPVGNALILLRRGTGSKGDRL